MMEEDSFNDWADFWRYTIGANVIPADTKNKMTWVEWSEYQDRPVSKEQHEAWKTNGDFNKGMAVIVGRIWHGQDRSNYYLVVIDADNQKAIRELCTRNDNTMTLGDFAAKTLIEQHKDNPSKAHFYFYSPRPLAKKGSDGVRPELAAKLKAEGIPAIEVKSLGSHGIMFCSPSIHKNGHPYEILGAKEPAILNDQQADELERHIDSICRKYGLQYLGSEGDSGKPELPMEQMFEPQFKILAGHNRHEGLLRAAESLLTRTGNILTDNKIRQLAYEWNQEHCEPPLDDGEFNRQWKAAKEFVEKTKRMKEAKSSQEQRSEAGKKEVYIQKYSTQMPLAEAVLVGGRPKFLQLIDAQVILKDALDLPDLVLKPLGRHDYLSKEYWFDSEEEVGLYINRAKVETIDSLYNRVKKIWSKYIDASNDHIAICAADTIFTYFQDRLGMTHYLMFVGDNGTGKSNNLSVFQHLGYRALFDTSITPANIYQYLGSIEEGQGTILEDEADNIDLDSEKMRIYKVGYKAGTKVSRIDTSTGRKQQGYWTYCFKAFSAERQPDSVRGKGFNERTFVIQCSIGTPKFDISEVLDSVGDSSYKELHNELIDVRKVLLAYRLLHFNDTLPNPELSILGRERQLCKPLIRLFKDTSAINEILPVLSRIISQKRNRKQETLEARLHAIIVDLVRKHGNTLDNGVIWSAIRERLDGFEPSHKPMCWHISELGTTISKKKVTSILVDRFNAVRGKVEERNLTFDTTILQKMGKAYGASEEIKILQSAPDTSSGDKTVATVSTDSGSSKELPKLEDRPKSVEVASNLAQIDVESTDDDEGKLTYDGHMRLDKL